MLPWEQGGARMESSRPSISGRRGPGGRDAQAGWGQADQDAPPWEAQSQPSARGGQWVGTDDWPPPDADTGRGNADKRGQGHMGARDHEGWPWGAGQASPAGQNGDQWGQAAGAPMGRGNDQWGQGPASPAMGRGNDQWGQGPGNSRPRGQENDQWGQAAGAPMGRGDDQWGQGPAASPAVGRDNDQWGQGAAMGVRGQDQWGAPNGYNTGQAEDQGFDLRGGARRGAEPAAQADGQWGQGNWGQANAGWNNAEPAGQWGQSP